MSLPNLARLALPLGSVTGSPFGLGHLDRDTLVSILQEFQNDRVQLCKKVQELCGGLSQEQGNSPECEGIWQRLATHLQMPPKLPQWTWKKHVIWFCSISAGAPNASILTWLLQQEYGLTIGYLLHFSSMDSATETADGKKLVTFGDDTVSVRLTFKTDIVRSNYFKKQSSYEFEFGQGAMRRMNVVYGMRGFTPGNGQWQEVETGINAIDDLSEDGRVVRRVYDLSRYNRANDTQVYPVKAYVRYRDDPYDGHEGVSWDEDNIHLKILYEDGRVEFYEASKYTNRRAHPTNWSPAYVLKGVMWQDGAVLQGDDLLFNDAYNDFLAITLGTHPGRPARTT